MPKLREDAAKDETPDQKLVRAIFERDRPVKDTSLPPMQEQSPWQREV